MKGDLREDHGREERNKEEEEKEEEEDGSTGKYDGDRDFDPK